MLHVVTPKHHIKCITYYHIYHMCNTQVAHFLVHCIYVNSDLTLVNKYCDLIMPC